MKIDGDNTSLIFQFLRVTIIFTFSIVVRERNKHPVFYFSSTNTKRHIHHEPVLPSPREKLRLFLLVSFVFFNDLIYVITGLDHLRSALNKGNRYCNLRQEDCKKASESTI